jgi:hypothetical protein
MQRSKGPEGKQKEQTMRTREITVVDFKAGAPSKYTGDMPGRVRELARLGLTIVQIAVGIGVKEGLLRKWLQDKPEVREAYDQGKHIFDYGIELALQQRALGFEYTEVKHIEGVDAIGRPYSFTTTTKKRALPDVTACIYWTKSRSPERWRDPNSNTNVNLTQVNNNMLVRMEKVLTPEQMEMVRNVARISAQQNNVSRGE